MIQKKVPNANVLIFAQYFITIIYSVVEWMQGCALRKIEESPVLRNCEIQSAQHMLFMKKLRFLGRPRTNVRRQRPPGAARPQPWDESLAVIRTNLS